MAGLSKLQKAYREFFKALMDEYGVKSPVQLKTADQRKEFFSRIKKEWPKAKAKIQEIALRTEIRIMIKEVLNETTKSAGVKKVLQLMDKGYDYTAAVKKVSKEDKLDIKKLEKDLEPFI